MLTDTYQTEGSTISKLRAGSELPGGMYDWILEREGPLYYQSQSIMDHRFMWEVHAPTAL